MKQLVVYEVKHNDVVSGLFLDKDGAMQCAIHAIPNIQGTITTQHVTLFEEYREWDLARRKAVLLESASNPDNIHKLLDFLIATAEMQTVNMDALNLKQKAEALLEDIGKKLPAGAHVRVPS